MQIGVIYKDFIWNMHTSDNLSTLTVLLILCKDGSLDDSILDAGEPMNLSTSKILTPQTPLRLKLRIKSSGQDTQGQIVGILTMGKNVDAGLSSAKWTMRQGNTKANKNLHPHHTHSRTVISGKKLVRRNVSAASRAAKKSKDKARSTSQRKKAVSAAKGKRKSVSVNPRHTEKQYQSAGSKRKGSHSASVPVPLKKKRLAAPTSTAAEKIRCVIYKEEYSSQRNLNKHVQQEHSTFQFGCSMKGCSCKFATITSLIKHRKVYHSAHTFQCDHKNCGKKFAYEKDLKDYKDIHLDESKYACTHKKCVCTFKTQAALKAHLKVHENKTYPCEQCKFVSATNAELQ